MRQGGRMVEERRRREKVGVGVIGRRGTQPLLSRVMGAMEAIGSQLEIGVIAICRIRLDVT